MTKKVRNNTKKIILLIIQILVNIWELRVEIISDITYQIK